MKAELRSEWNKKIFHCFSRSDSSADVGVASGFRESWNVISIMKNCVSCGTWWIGANDVNWTYSRRSIGDNRTQCLILIIPTRCQSCVSESKLKWGREQLNSMWNALGEARRVVKFHSTDYDNAMREQQWRRFNDAFNSAQNFHWYTQKRSRHAIIIMNKILLFNELLKLWKASLGSWAVVQSADNPQAWCIHGNSCDRSQSLLTLPARNSFFSLLHSSRTKIPAPSTPLLALFTLPSNIRMQKTVIDILSDSHMTLDGYFSLQLQAQTSQLSGDMIDEREKKAGEIVNGTLWREPCHINRTAISLHFLFSLRASGLGRKVARKVEEGKKIHFVCVNIEHENG